ncbi:hypothetical protein ACROYT_G024818 [Oculina patagonica]
MPRTRNAEVLNATLNIKRKKTRDLSSNAIATLSSRVFATLSNMYTMSLSSNSIKFLPDEIFATMTNLANL